MSEKFLTRQGAVEYIRSHFGVPVSKSTIDKSRMLFDEPKPDKFYGPKELFTTKTLDAYTLKRLISDRPTKLIPGNEPEAA